MMTVGPSRIAVRATVTLLAAFVLAILFDTVLVQAHTNDFSGKLINQVWVHPTNAFSGPIAGQWNDGQTHLLPGTSFAVRVPKHKSKFSSVTTSGVAGILL